MVDDVGQLLRKQARVDRMTNVSGAADPVVRLQVPVIVPCQCGDAITMDNKTASSSSNSIIIVIGFESHTNEREVTIQVKVC